MTESLQETKARGGSSSSSGDGQDVSGVKRSLADTRPPMVESPGSTITYGTDVPEDMPLPQAEDPDDDQAETAKQGEKRQRSPGDEGDEERGDPQEPEEVDMGGMLMSMKVVRREGRFDVVEMFSPPRVAVRAKVLGLRAG